MGVNDELWRVLLVALGAGCLVGIRLSPIYVSGSNTRKHALLFQRLTIVAILFGAGVSLLSLVALPPATVLQQTILITVGSSAFILMRSLSWSLIAGFSGYALSVYLWT